MDDPIIDLQSRLAFQEQTIQELNEVITDQQQQLDQLREELRILEQRIVSLAETQPVSSEKEPPPPHY